MSVGNNVAIGDLIFCGAGDDVTVGDSPNYNMVVSGKGPDTINSVGPDQLVLKPDVIVNGDAQDYIWLRGDSPSNLSGTTDATIQSRNGKVARYVAQAKAYMRKAVRQ